MLPFLLRDSDRECATIAGFFALRWGISQEFLKAFLFPWDKNWPGQNYGVCECERN